MWSRTIERSLGVIPMSGIEIHKQPFVRKLGKLESKIVFLVSLDRTNGSYAQVQLPHQQVAAYVLRSNCETTAGRQPTPFEAKTIKSSLGPINKPVPFDVHQTGLRLTSLLRLQPCTFGFPLSLNFSSARVCLAQCKARRKRYQKDTHCKG